MDSDLQKHEDYYYLGYKSSVYALFWKRTDMKWVDAVQLRPRLITPLVFVEKVNNKPDLNSNLVHLTNRVKANW